MNLNCAILHADPEIAGRLEEYIDKVPFLSLHGKYGNPLEAQIGRASCRERV